MAKRRKPKRPFDPIGDDSPVTLKLGFMAMIMGFIITGTYAFFRVQALTAQNQSDIQSVRNSLDTAINTNQAIQIELAKINVKLENIEKIVNQ